MTKLGLGNSNDNVDWSGPFLNSELRSQLLGKLLARGQYRKVFECRYDPTIVIKVDDVVNDRYCNVVEWRTWQEHRDFPRVADWLAPCLSISPNGAVLIQRKAEPLKEYPKRLPSFLIGDIKPDNFGLLNGHVVKIDYGHGLRVDTPLRLETVDPNEWLK